MIPLKCLLVVGLFNTGEFSHRSCHMYWTRMANEINFSSICTEDYDFEYMLEEFARRGEIKIKSLPSSALETIKYFEFNIRSRQLKVGGDIYTSGKFEYSSEFKIDECP